MRPPFRTKREDTITVTLEVSAWRRIADRARYQAEKTEDWTIPNLLGEVFDLAKEM